MKTSNFANWQRQKFPGAISISRYPATRQGWNGPEFPPLMPSTQLLQAYKDGSIDWDEYRRQYQIFTLSPLDPRKTWDILQIIAARSAPDTPGPVEPVLLCYESAKTLSSQPCHRRLVAEWFEQAFGGFVIPEWSKDA